MTPHSSNHTPPPTTIEELLAQVQSGSTAIATAAQRLRELQTASFVDLVHTKLDTARMHRRGVPEVVLGENKSAEQIAEIVASLQAAGQPTLATRVSPEKAEHVIAAVPGLHWNTLARCVYTELPAEDNGRGLIAVLTAGTSDLAVAEEAIVTARIMGSRVETRHDVGVAGLHRLLTSSMELLDKARCIVVAAGMEGALPSVVGGLVRCPVVAIPTSVGYGVSAGGYNALLSMLGSCAGGIATVNIDNGFGAGLLAHLINAPWWESSDTPANSAGA